MRDTSSTSRVLLHILCRGWAHPTSINLNSSSCTCWDVCRCLLFWNNCNRKIMYCTYCARFTLAINHFHQPFRYYSLCIPSGSVAHIVGSVSHETNKSWNLLFKTVEIGLSGLVNWTLWFCQDWWQSRAPPSFDEVLILRPSDVWTVKRRKPR
jgi:hypothetical protein